MKPKTAALATVLITVLGAPVALADSGSAWLDRQVQTLQRQVGMRNAVADAVTRFQLAHGYSVPEQLVARADDDAFKHELALLNQSIRLDDARPVAMMDAASGSDWLDRQMQALQRQLAVRNTVADAALSFQQQHGYTLPEQLIARADDDAFSHELAMLSMVIQLNQLGDQ